MPRYEPPPIISLAESYRTGFLILDEQRRVVRHDGQLETVLAPAPGDPFEPMLEALLAEIAPTLDRMEAEERQSLDNIRIRVDRGRGKREFVVQATQTDGTCRRWFFQVQDAEELERTSRDMRLATRFRVLARYYQTTAHDLKQPIAVISMYIELLKDLLQKSVAADEDTMRKQLDYLGTVEEASKGVGESLQALLSNFSTADEAKGAFSLNDVLSRCAQFIEVQARLQKVAFSVHMPEAEVKLRGNPDQFRQVVTNLCVNSLEAMPEGGELELAAEANEDRVQIRVADTGLGMDEDTARRAFRVHFTTKPTGNGVGLNGVQKVIEDLGGRIAFETEPGEGTTFEFWVPRTTEDARAA